MATPEPPDAAARTAVRTRLDETMFLEAGAGSGKTSCLVERFVALIELGVPADAIAAITFTERAAAELADRIRREVQRRAATSQLHRDALEVLDRAAISTLHSFAQRVLTEHPIEAGLPPRVEVLDEITSEVAFARRWDAFVDRMLDDPALEQPLRLLFASDAKLEQLRDVAAAFGDNWDLVTERRSGQAPTKVVVNVEALCDDLEALAAEASRSRDGSDRLAVRLSDLGEYASALRDAVDDETRIQLLRHGGPSFRAGHLGQAANWPGGKSDLSERIAELGQRRDELVARVAHLCLVRMAEALADFTVEAAEDRQREGRLEFHDLLVLARQVLRDPENGPAVRQALRRRYQRLLLDEFQDTDPIQIELAVLVASNDPNAGQRPWQEVDVKPGRLFFVGDPKQSIYRFRRADIGVFLAARNALVDQPEQLTANFRTGEDIVAWVNRTFETLIVEDPGSQPAYLRLDAQRAQAKVGPAVMLLGEAAHHDRPNADTLRQREAADVVSAIRQAVAEGWTVEDPQGTWRPASWRDIAILLPARTSLTILERALETAEVPYRAETSSLVYGTREVRDVLAVVRAVDDPTDMLSLVTALRSPAFGCGDDDLYAWKVTYRGRWDHQAPLPDGCPSEHPVALGMAWLSELHQRRTWVSPSEVVDEIIRERRLLEVAFVHPRPRDLWRRLRFVVDQARAWEEAAGGSLRDYLTWVELQSAESARVVETVLPETDDESVRIMTVHGAKGLEFPITVLSGLTTQLKGRRRGVEVRFPPGESGWAIKLGSGIATAEFDAYVPRDEQMDHDERLRLLYVAATRARDHLVVSVHRKKPSPSASPSTAAELFAAHGHHDDLMTAFNPPAASTVVTIAPVPISPPPLARNEWGVERTRAFAIGTRRLAVSATTLAEEQARRLAEEAATADPGLAKDPRDLDLPPWQKGRYGSAVGRAVHAVLQTVDLATGAGIDEAAAAQAAAEGVFGRERVIADLARSAISSDVVHEAVQRPHWREVYVGAPVGDLILEGYIDLLFRTDEGLVVVDYKTDSWRTEADLDAKVERYRPQLAAYATAVATATGDDVAGGILLFLSPAGAQPRELGDLAVNIEVPATLGGL